jgi:hypothetical protein
MIYLFVKREPFVWTLISDYFCTQLRLMYLVAFAFIFMHVCVCTYMRAQLDPAVQVYTGRSKRICHICWHEGEYEACKTRGTSAYTHMWYIFM